MRTPRLALSVKLEPVVNSVAPPFSTILPGVADPGVAPRLASVATLRVAPFPTVTGPVNVLPPDKVKSPLPVSFKPKPPEIMPFNDSDPKLVMLMFGVVCRQGED